ncbi:hypothetical protein [Thermicanus aegyptius]|uniref:hypothetical protein n=1 Tax=Thermicanus aegyptius TaxID=94009 RepID=UPI00040108E6|nr:hypothetical protein [Thermicanus aegyptius]
MSLLRATDHVVETTQLEDFGEKLLKNLANYQRNTNLCPNLLVHVQKAIKIIKKKAYGRVSIHGKCDSNQKDGLFVQISFIHRKEVVAMKVLVYTSAGWSKGSQVRSNTRKKIKGKTIDLDLLWRLKDVLILMIGPERVLRLKNYLEYREKRQKLLKAAKCGIDVDELKEILKSDYYHRYVHIEFIDFDEPFLLVGTTEKHILYTPYGKYEVGMDTFYARRAFREFVKVKRVPYGKDAMKKIEALLIQASI